MKLSIFSWETEQKPSRVINNFYTSGFIQNNTPRRNKYFTDIKFGFEKFSKFNVWTNHWFSGLARKYEDLCSVVIKMISLSPPRTRTDNILLLWVYIGLIIPLLGLISLQTNFILQSLETFITDKLQTLEIIPAFIFVKSFENSFKGWL